MLVPLATTFIWIIVWKLASTGRGIFLISGIIHCKRILNFSIEVDPCDLPKKVMAFWFVGETGSVLQIINRQTHLANS